jgi:hypothetical protein
MTLTDEQMFMLEQYIKWEGGWEVLWSIIYRDPIILDHVWKYLHERVEDFERREYPDGLEERD